MCLNDCQPLKVQCLSVVTSSGGHLNVLLQKVNHASIMGNSGTRDPCLNLCVRTTKLTTAQCWLLLVVETHISMLNAKRSPHLMLVSSGGVDPCLNF